MTAFNEKLRLVPKLLILLSLALSVVGSQPARAAGTWYVAPGGDDGNSCLSSSEPCATIDGAIGKAASGDSVYVAVGTYTGSTSSAVVTIERSLTLSLSGGWDAGFTSQTDMSIIDGQNSRPGLRINEIDTSVTINVMLENFTIQNGYASADGGGIYIYGGDLTINHSLIKNNTSTMMGGGIHLFCGTLTINNTILKDNKATYDGGGIDNYCGTVTLNDSVISGNIVSNGTGNGSGIYSDHILILNNSTVSGNTGGEVAIYFSGTSAAINSSTIANNEGKGIAIDYGTLKIRNTIAADNSYVDLYNDVFYHNGVVNSLGYNLIETYQGFILASSDLTNIDPKLGSLQDNGGSTLTQALLPGSPAINAGNPFGCLGSAGLLTTDQRGFPRSGRCDIGAFEVNPLDFSIMTVTPAQAPAGSLVTYTIIVSNGGAANIDPVSATDILPGSLAYLDGSLSATSGNASYAAGVITWTGPVNAGSDVTITFSATVGPAAGGTDITNEAVIAAGEGMFSRTAKLHVPPPWRTFLPLVIHPIPGLYGRVTLNGAAAYGILLDLRCFNGAYWYTLAQTNTDADGNYAFKTLPSLITGQAYYVRFSNPDRIFPDYLSTWHTRSLTSYGAGDSVNMGEFDLANVSLVSPNPGRAALPVTFQWASRAATPDDSYQVELFDPSGSSDFITPLLGYVNSYLMKYLPDGFEQEVTYGWCVWVNGPDGGYGASLYYNPITFSNTGYSLSQSLPTTAQRNRVDLGDEFYQRAAP